MSVKIQNTMLGHFFPTLARLSSLRIHQDVRIVCENGEVRAARLLLCLAFPTLADLLHLGEEEGESVLLMPQFTTLSILQGVDQLLEGVQMKTETGSESDRIQDDYETEEDMKGDEHNGLQTREKVMEEDKDYTSNNNPIEGSYLTNTEGQIIQNLYSSSNVCEEPKNYNCSDCDKWFSRRDNLYKHFRQRHPEGDLSPFKGNRVVIPVTDPSELVCQVCKQHCANRGRLKDHMRKHSDLKNFICIECGKRFKGVDGLKAHMKKHRGEYDYKCDQCSSKYVTPSALLNHKTSKHSDGFQFTCEHCGKGYSNRPSYSVHLTSHTGEKPYKCREGGCEKRFRKHGARENHERQHRGVKEFHCHLCPKEFMQKRQLAVHIKRHLGQKDHVCRECGKAYVEAAGAKNCKHVQRVPAHKVLGTLVTF